MNCIVCADEIHQMFYTSVGPTNQVDTYCYSCYHSAVLDNYPEMKASGTKVVEEVCECGTKAKRGQNHSGWCDLFRQEV